MSVIVGIESSNDWRHCYTHLAHLFHKILRHFVRSLRFFLNLRMLILFQLIRKPLNTNQGKNLFFTCSPSDDQKNGRVNKNWFKWEVELGKLLKLVKLCKKKNRKGKNDDRSIHVYLESEILLKRRLVSITKTCKGQHCENKKNLR